jgi:hypothetical protein
MIYVNVELRTFQAQAQAQAEAQAEAFMPYRKMRGDS